VSGRLAFNRNSGLPIGQADGFDAIRLPRPSARRRRIGDLSTSCPRRQQKPEETEAVLTWPVGVAIDAASRVGYAPGLPPQIFSRSNTVTVKPRSPIHEPQWSGDSAPDDEDLVHHNAPWTAGLHTFGNTPDRI
jgi:hypothetical protein